MKLQTMTRRVVLCAFLAAACLRSQTYTGSIGGRVMDSGGLPIPRAAVSITEESTNTVLKTVTSETGDYIVNYLKPGNYRVQFAAPGFKEHLETGIQLQINQARRVDPVLEIGRVTESVEVSASAAQINYVSPEIGQTVDSDQLINLPEVATNSRGRSPFLLAKLLPGVTTNGNTYTNINGFSFAGGRRVTNEILVDGLPTTNPSDETYTLTPSPDSIQEFKVLTTPFSAEYGHTGGGVMIATSRGGGNALHGSAYDLFRNRILNTRDFFAVQQSATKYVQNDPGGTIGGPVYIPQGVRRKKQDVLLRGFQRYAGFDRQRVQRPGPDHSAKVGRLFADILRGATGADLRPCHGAHRAGRKDYRTESVPRAMSFPPAVSTR